MIVAQVEGNLAAEKSSDAYPTNVFCDECYEQMKASENNPIITTETYDSSWPDICCRCEKTEDEENEENTP